MSEKTQNMIPRPPIVVVMGHIDHGKSTLLDYIRKSNVVEGEEGGITQHLSAYEAIHTGEGGAQKRITFLDTPGHEAFSQMRAHGAEVADIAILIVSAEDGVKAQTIEALADIKKAKIPFVIAINKIDKPNANPERVKNELVEHEIYIEGYGGDIPAVSISAKTGEGIPELLDMIVLLSEMGELSANPNVPAEGIVIESLVDPSKGISATLIITNGTLTKGSFVATFSACAPVRIMEDFTGKSLDTATFSSPVRIIGFSYVPRAGEHFTSFSSKKKAEEHACGDKATHMQKEILGDKNAKVLVPIILKTDVLGTLDAVKKEILKAIPEKVGLMIVQEGVGDITENDINLASSDQNTYIIGFRVSADRKARDLAEKEAFAIHTFGIIYNITDFLEKELRRFIPREEQPEFTGSVKVLRVFSKTKDKQVVGGRVEEGVVRKGARVKIRRRDTEIGEGVVSELQVQKVSVDEAPEGAECGMMIESKMIIAEGDHVAPFMMVKK